MKPSEMDFDQWLDWVEAGALDRNNRAVQSHCRTIRSHRRAVERAERIKDDNPPGSAAHMVASLILRGSESA